MSDKEATWHGNANEGITLPDGQGATHNIGFSPLFIARTGAKYSRTTSDEKYISFRQQVGFLWSKTVYLPTEAYDIIHNTADGNLVLPSHHYNRTVAFPLRCLVSTKRQASE